MIRSAVALMPRAVCKPRASGDDPGSVYDVNSLYP